MSLQNNLILNLCFPLFVADMGQFAKNVSLYPLISLRPLKYTSDNYLLDVCFINKNVHLIDNYQMFI